MKISELILELEKAKEKHGDIDCVVELPESLAYRESIYSTIETVVFKGKYSFYKSERPIIFLDWRR